MRKGGFYSIKFHGRNDFFSGIVLDYNNEWVLIRRCFDYRLDGYTVVRRSKIHSVIYDEFEKRAMLILKKKNYHYSKDERVNIKDIDTLIKVVANKYKLLQIDTNDGKAFDVVKFQKMVNGLYFFKELTVNCKWRYNLTLSESKLNFISFDTDYLNSLKLISGRI